MLANKLTKVAILYLTVLSIALTSCGGGSAATKTQAPANDLLVKILARGTIVVATDPAYPPQSERIAGAKRAANTKCAENEYTAAEFDGYDVASAMEVAKRLGVEACFVTPQWGEIISGSWAGRWDLSSGSMVITPERLKVLYFTQPYAAGFNVIFVHKDNVSFAKPSDLSGKRVGTCAGCVNEDYLKGTLVMPGATVNFAVKNAKIIGYNDDLSALQDLSKGDGVILDGVVTDQETGLQSIKNGLSVKQLSEPAFFSYSAMATDKKDSANSMNLSIKVSEIIKQALDDGTLAKISKQYYNGTDYATAASQFDFKSLGQFP
jgi:polar amino acid transport system substrate-binding protein